MNSTPFYYKSEDYNQSWNILCAYMDRIEDVSSLLNSLELDSSVRLDYHKLTLVFTYTGILWSCVLIILETFKCNKNLINCGNNFTIPHDIDATDSEFFKHIRNLTFAHVLDTDYHSKFLKTGEKLCAPIIKNDIEADKILIIVYSNIRKTSEVSFTINKQELFSFIRHTYELVDYIRDKLKNDLDLFLEGSKHFSVNVFNSIVDQLNELRAKYVYLYDDTTVSSIDWLLFLYEYESDDELNKQQVEMFKVYTTPIVVDFVSKSNNDEDTDNHEFYRIINQRWETNEPMSNYILEKVRTKLTKENAGENNYGFIPNQINSIPDDIEFGFEQLQSFKQLLSDKYLKIDYGMQFDEIQLLVTVALFLSNKNTS